MLASFFRKMIGCILGENSEKSFDNRRLREINFLSPKLDYLNSTADKLSA
ncbi:MAG: hypothetical protein KBA53_12015 [Thermoclostridium sp.]|nr:hypothetical protein [Thermoclostridium sp.]